MADIKSFEINGRKYSLDSMAPDDALGFGNRVLGALAPLVGGLKELQGGDLEGKEIQDKALALIASAALGFDSKKADLLCREALNYVITPEMTYLKDAAVRNQWFTRYPEDMLFVAYRAVWELFRPFMGQLPTTLLQNFTAKAKEALLTSQKDGK